MNGPNPEQPNLDKAQQAALIRALLHFTKRAVDAEDALFRIGCEVSKTYPHPRIGISDRSTVR